ncbi:MAG TPA: hypothetical protein VMS08_00985 [Candidatus Saccharimonadia bacterium]|nr:hypothetical protein [Candidatus Saccharimonadia bacterium]
MAVGTVTEMGESKSHKPKFKIGGRWYSAGKCPVLGLHAGMTIDFESSSYEYDGKTYWGLEAWKPVTPVVAATPGERGAPEPSHAVPQGLDEAQLRFVSNCVGSAIANGACSSPSDIRQWFNSAKACFE